MRSNVKVHVIKGLLPLKTLLAPIAVYFWPMRGSGNHRVKEMVSEWNEEPDTMSLRPHREMTQGGSFGIFLSLSLATSSSFRDIRKGPRVGKASFGPSAPLLQEAQVFGVQRMAPVAVSMSTVFSAS